MVWYIPPLSPILKHVEADVYLPDAADMRIPLEYLAQLFAAGDVAVVKNTLARLLEMRTVMRYKETKESLPEELSLHEAEYEKMYRLLAIAKRKDRVVIPAGLQAETHERLRELQGSAGYVCPGGC